MPDLILAHPLTEPAGFGLPPAFVAGVTVLVAILISRVSRPAATATVSTGIAPADAPERAATGSWVSAALLLAMIALARLGPAAEVRNLASPLVLGVVWPVLLLSIIAGRRWWPRASPFPPLARALERLGGQQPTATDDDHEPTPGPLTTWLALPSALALGWYLSAHPTPLDPRTLSVALAGYLIAMMAGALALGTRHWLGVGDAIAVLSSTAAEAPRPRGAQMGLLMVLGALLGSLAFGVMRLSILWVRFARLLGVASNDLLATTMAWAAVVAITLALVLVLGRWVRASGGRIDVLARSLALLACGLGVVQALVFERLLKAVVLVIGLASDPLGRGWDVFGTAGIVPANELMGPTALLVAQLGVLVLVGALAARRAVAADPAAATPHRVLVGLTVLVVASAAAAA